MKMKANGCIKRVFSRFMGFVRRLGASLPMTTIQNSIETHNELRRSLSSFQLLAINLGYIIGTGIFVLSGQVAANYTGPAVIISFVLASIVAGISAMSFSEMASMMPICGSTYSYVYASLGEYFAWIIGWNGILRNCLSAAACAVSWSGYVIHFFETVSKRNVTKVIVQAPIAWNETTKSFYFTDAVINLPAFTLIIGLTILLVIGIVASTRVVVLNVLIKIITILLFIFACVGYIKRANFSPFIPSNEGSPKKFGVTGMLYGVTVVFFAYTGSDASTTVAQETVNPQRSLPKGILGSFIISTILYLGVCIAMVGVVPYKMLNTRTPIIEAIKGTPHGIWLVIFMDLGIIGGLPSVALGGLLAPPRVFYSMAHDGLLPPILGKVHPHTKTPWISTIITGVVCAVCAGIFPLDILREMASLTILLPYFIVHINVIIMRFKYKNVSRRFRIPLGPWVIPLLGAILCLLLMIATSKETAIRLSVWMGIGQIVYFSYGFWHSKLHRSRRAVNFTVILDDVAGPSQNLSSELTTNQSNSYNHTLEALSQ